MGGIKLTRKKYETPGHPFQGDRIEEELRILGRYALRNKREVWKLRAKVRTARSNARDLLALREEDRAKGGQELLARLYSWGVLAQDAKLDDVLSLSIMDFAERRLQTMVAKRGLAQSLMQARQLIAHRHIAINGQIMNSPGYLVKRGEDESIDFIPSSPLADKNHPLRKPKVAVPVAKPVPKQRRAKPEVEAPPAAEGTQPELNKPAPGEEFVRE